MSYNRIEFGTFSFEDNAIFSGSIRVAQNPLGTTLEINTVKAEVLCNDPKILQFKLNTPIKLYHLNEQLGIFYAQEVYLVKANRYRISGVSAIGLLDNMAHYGGIYTGETVGDVLKGLFQSIPYAVKTSIEKIKLYGYLPVATARSNLSQILVACGAVVRTDLDGVIRIEDLYDGPSNVLPPSKVFIKSSIKYNAPVTDVVVTEHQYIKNPNAEEQTLFEGTVTEGDIVTFKNPVYDLTAEGVKILTSNANYARLSSGSAIIKGKEYIHTKREATHHIQDSEVKSTKKVDEATLVSLVNSGSVAKRVAEYYRSNEVLQMDFIRERQNTGEIIETVNPYEYTEAIGFAESMEISLGRHLYGEADLVAGYLPERVEDIGILDERVVLTGSGEWEPPEYATNVRAVLISGGSGGTAGNPGKDGQGNQLVLTSSEAGAGGTWAKPPNEPGNGGKGGAGGLAGKVLLIDIALSPGVKVKYSCGFGGEGGTNPDTPGAPGTPTVFGEYTSDSGSVPQYGYTDPVTGEVYAAPAPQGFDGAAGGKGGTASLNEFNPGEQGGNVGENIGGEGGTGGYSNGDIEKNRAGGGGGGGAAKGANGEAAYGTSGKGQNGGNGASAITPQEPTLPGSGGLGGNGGGGGGSAGGIFLSLEPHTGSGGAWAQFSGGLGGNGSPGSNGAPGCIIIYFSKQIKAPSGAFKENQSRWVLDRFGRRFIV